MMRGGQNANELCKDPFAKPPMKAQETVLVEEKGSKGFELGLIGAYLEGSSSWLFSSSLTSLVTGENPPPLESFLKKHSLIK
ncbi:hypothetical protein V6N12_070342 [Hibiscus sabdariffa]|uniref:Uncharacterized protein n=1 Tax=Hibiscus sabdariffa TaxID=183260 RepID=A0ABR2FGH7_9ROSI